MIGRQFGFDAVHGKQAPADARVFTGNDIRLAEDGDGAEAQILGVADRGGDQVKARPKRPAAAFTSARRAISLPASVGLLGWTIPPGAADLGNRG
jgi:hypothetical protein